MSIIARFPASAYRHKVRVDRARSAAMAGLQDQELAVTS
jgi:hypothetical protein